MRTGWQSSGFCGDACRVPAKGENEALAQNRLQAPNLPVLGLGCARHPPLLAGHSLGCPAGSGAWWGERCSALPPQDLGSGGSRAQGCRPNSLITLSGEGFVPGLGDQCHRGSTSVLGLRAGG